MARRVQLWVCAACAWLMMSWACQAADAPPPGASATAAASVVNVGTLVNRINSISLRDGNFVVDFYIWFRWSNPNVNPGETFEIANGHVEDKYLSDSSTLASGDRYESYRMRAVVSHDFDIERFPLDRHRLVLAIEDASEETKVLYLPDAVNSSVQKSFTAPGFKLVRNEVSVLSNAYNTNYGDTDLPTGNEARYSRYVVTLDLERPDAFYAVKVLFGVYLSMFISLVTCFIYAEDVDPRFGLGAAAVFAVMASQLVISGSLPDTSTLTIADKIAVSFTLLIFLSIAVSIYSLRLVRTGREAASRRVDVYAFLGLTVMFLLSNFYAFSVA